MGVGDPCPSCGGQTPQARHTQLGDLVDVLASPPGRRLFAWAVSLLLSSALVGERCTPVASAATILHLDTADTGGQEP